MRPTGGSKKLRIVSLAPNATCILCALGARSQLVGVTRWCPDVAPVKHLPRFGDCWKLESVPRILKLKPDLVIGSVPFKTEMLGKLLENPLRFLALNPRSLADIESDIRVAAGLVGFALGSETSGSIMTPAAFSGISGLRPERYTTEISWASAAVTSPSSSARMAWPDARAASPSMPVPT